MQLLDLLSYLIFVTVACKLEYCSYTYFDYQRKTLRIDLPVKKGLYEYVPSCILDECCKVSNGNEKVTSSQIRYTVYAVYTT